MPQGYAGMSLRDRFAVEALGAQITCLQDDSCLHAIANKAEEDGISLKRRLARSAYEYADAMLEERGS